MPVWRVSVPTLALKPSMSLWSPRSPPPARTLSTRGGTVSSQAARCARTSRRVIPDGSFSSYRSLGTASSTARVATYMCSTRASRSLLEIPGIVVDTEHLLQDEYLLVGAGVCSRTFEEPGHQLAARLRGLP